MFSQGLWCFNSVIERLRVYDHLFVQLSFILLLTWYGVDSVATAAAAAAAAAAAVGCCCLV